MSTAQGDCRPRRPPGHAWRFLHHGTEPGGTRRVVLPVAPTLGCAMREIVALRAGNL